MRAPRRPRLRTPQLAVWPHRLSSRPADVWSRLCWQCTCGDVFTDARLAAEHTRR